MFMYSSRVLNAEFFWDECLYVTSKWIAGLYVLLEMKCHVQDS